MKRSIDLVVASKIIMAVIICGAVFIMFSGMLQFGEGQSGRQVSAIVEVINKALVQCYALEGSYPKSLDQLQKYGVVLDEDKYIYHFESLGGNMRPNVIVIKK